jgi:hypothetical protein
MTPRPPGFTDVQLELLLAGAREIAPEMRSRFLSEVVAELLASNAAVDAVVVRVSARMRERCCNGDCA